MNQDEDECSYEEVEEVYEIDEEGNEWLVTEEEEEFEELEEDAPDSPTVVIANLGALEHSNQNVSSLPLTTNNFRGHRGTKDQVRGYTSTVFGDTSTVQVSNVRNHGNSPNSKRLGLGSRFKNLVGRPEQAKEQSQSPKAQVSASMPTTEPAKKEPTPQPKKTRQVRRIRKPRGSVEAEGSDPVDPVSETLDEEPNEPKAVYTLSIVKDETTGRELSRTVTGKKPPHYQPQGPNEKRYMTKTYRKTRTNPVNRHKEVEETTVIFEKPRSPIFEQTLPAAALIPTNDLNPARKTTQWEQPVWVKNKLEAGSTIRAGANLEKPITAATSNRQKAGALSFTIERA